MQIDGIDSYIEEKRFLEKFWEKSRSQKIPVIDIDTGMFLEYSVLLSRPESILEIGCGNGFSTYFLVKNLQDRSGYTGIDLNKERLLSAESFIKKRFPGKKTKFIYGNALKIIPDLDNSFDLVFIDAAKSEYPKYISAIIKKLRSRSIIIADNILYKYKILSPKTIKHDKRSIKGLKEYIQIATTGKKCFSTSFFAIGDGLAVTIYGDNLDDRP